MTRVTTHATLMAKWVGPLFPVDRFFVATFAKQIQYFGRSNDDEIAPYYILYIDIYRFQFPTRMTLVVFHPSYIFPKNSTREVCTKKIKYPLSLLHVMVHDMVRDNVIRSIGTIKTIRTRRTNTFHPVVPMQSSILTMMTTTKTTTTTTTTTCFILMN